MSHTQVNLLQVLQFLHMESESFFRQLPCDCRHNKISNLDYKTAVQPAVQAFDLR